MDKSAADEGKPEMEFTDVETASDNIPSSVIFHVIIDILAFVLYMHQQIPNLLQDIDFEFEELQNEYKALETVVFQPEMKASVRREHLARKREVKQGLRRIEKLMKMIAALKEAIQHLITEIPHIERVTLVLGPSPLRPIHVYELYFSHERMVSDNFGKTKVSELLCRKAIRTLISMGAGSDRNSFAGPSKLFLLVKAPASLSLPSHFLPKRDFRYHKKTVPLKLRFKSRNHHLGADAQSGDSEVARSLLLESSPDNNIWFQCRHVIKGLASEASNED